MTKSGEVVLIRNGGESWGLAGHLHVTSADTIIQIERFRGRAGPYPAWTGGLWLCSTLVLSGFQAVVVPSGFRTKVQPHRWITTWW